MKGLYKIKIDFNKELSDNQKELIRSHLIDHFSRKKNINGKYNNNILIISFDYLFESTEEIVNDALKEINEIDSSITSKDFSIDLI